MEEKVKLKNVDYPKKRIVVISDTHFDSTGIRFNHKAFDRGIKKINEIEDVALYIHLGDITQYGLQPDYEMAEELMKKFNPISKAPIRYVMGNHDAKNVGYLFFEELIGERYFEYEDTHYYIIGIDSTKPDLVSEVQSYWY